MRDGKGDPSSGRSLVSRPPPPDEKDYCRGKMVDRDQRTVRDQKDRAGRTTPWR